MKKLFLLFLLINALTSFGQKNDIHRIEFFVGISNPKPAHDLANVYSHRILQPDFMIEYSAFRLRYTKSMALKFAATAGYYPSSFDNFDHLFDDEFTILKVRNIPLSVRAYPFSIHKDLDDLKLPDNFGAIIAAFFVWTAKSFYIEGGISPNTRFTEAGYDNETRSPQFYGWGFNILDLNDDARTRFRFDIGKRYYTWTNNNNGTSGINQFSMNFGISLKPGK